MRDRMSSATLNMTSPSALTNRTILPRWRRLALRPRGSGTGQDEEKASTQAHRISGTAGAGARRGRGALDAGLRAHAGRKRRGRESGFHLLRASGKVPAAKQECRNTGRPPAQQRGRSHADLKTPSIDAVQAVGTRVCCQFHQLSVMQRESGRKTRVTH